MFILKLIWLYFCCHSLLTSPVVSEARPEPCFILLLLTLVAPVLLHYCLISTSHFLKNLCDPKNKSWWLTPDQEEHSLCGQGIIPTTWTTLCSEQLWSLLIQQNTDCWGFFFSSPPFPHVLSKIFWHNHICYHTRARRSRSKGRGEGTGTGKIRKRAGKETTRRGCFESPNRLLPTIFRGWNFSLAVRRNSNPQSSCPQPARFEKKPPLHTLPPFPPLLSRLSQPGNQWETRTQTQHGCERDQDELLWHLGPTNKSVAWLDHPVSACMFNVPSLVLTSAQENSEGGQTNLKWSYFVRSGKSPAVTSGMSSETETGTCLDF